MSGSPKDTDKTIKMESSPQYVERIERKLYLNKDNSFRSRRNEEVNKFEK